MRPPVPQNNSPRVSKITLFLILTILLMLPFAVIKTQTQQSSQAITESPEQSDTLPSQPAPPLTQATLDDWSKKLASSSEADVQSVVELPKNQFLFPGVLKTLTSYAPFHFKLETFKQNTDNTSGTIAVEAGPQNKRQTLVVSLRVVNGIWKIVNVDTSSL